MVLGGNGMSYVASHHVASLPFPTVIVDEGIHAFPASGSIPIQQRELNLHGPFIHPHPTLSEVSGETALALAGRPLHA